MDLFVGEKGIYVVLADAVALVDRAGAELARVASSREITAAAFDGERLVVADRARLTSYDLDLGVNGAGDLVESCSSAVLVSGGRFVCGPSNDWDRVFYSYDADSGSLLASSSQYTYNGIPMGRVPGTDDFVTVTTGSSPSDFHLYSVADTDEAVFINESPYHGDFPAEDIYGFAGDPATHLITHTGLLLRIYGTGCTVEESTFSSECFVKDGDLGTLTGAQVFFGMDNGSDGKLYGIIDPNPTFFDGVCEESCIVQRIDITGRVVESQVIVTMQASGIVGLRADPASGAAIVGRVLPGQRFSDDPYPGYQITRVPLP